MTEYLIAFNGEWVPDHTVEELREKSKAVRALVAEMKAAGVFIFTGGLDDTAPVFSVDASSGTPLFTDGPFTETKEHLGGFAVVDVADEKAARLWAGKSRGGLRLAAGGATFPDPHASSGDFLTETSKRAYSLASERATNPRLGPWFAPLRSGDRQDRGCSSASRTGAVSAA